MNKIPALTSFVTLFPSNKNSDKPIFANEYLHEDEIRRLENGFSQKLRWRYVIHRILSHPLVISKNVFY